MRAFDRNFADLTRNLVEISRTALNSTNDLREYKVPVQASDSVTDCNGIRF